MRNHTSAISQGWESILMLATLIVIALLSPMLLRQQLITGTIVNGALVTGAALLGTRQALLIGLLPSSIALATGTISPALALLVPFIIIGNSILVVSVSLLKHRSYWMGAVAGSILKFAFLFCASFVVVGFMTNQKLAAAATQSLGWVQLVTALSGSILAFGVLRLIRKT